MNLSQLASALGKAAIYTRDFNAVVRGRAGQRIYNRVVGRVTSKIMRGVWK